MLTRKFFERLSKPQLTQERFTVMREREKQAYTDFIKSPPYIQASILTSDLIEMKRWQNHDVLEYVVSDLLTWSALRDFVENSLFSRCKVQALAHGNIDATEACALVEEVSNILRPPPLCTSEFPADLRILELPPGRPVVIRRHPQKSSRLLERFANAHETNSAVEVYLQVGLQSRPLTGILQLAAQIIDTHALQQLRTVEQLGYIVETSCRLDRAVMGLSLIVQSSTHNAAALDERVEAFLETVPSLLANTSSKDFAKYRRASIDVALKKDQGMREESSQHWRKIVPLGSYEFDHLKRNAQAMASVTQRDLCEFWERYMAVESPRRRRLSSQVFAPRFELPAKPSRGNAVYLDSLEEILEFRASLPVFPMKRRCG